MTDPAPCLARHVSDPELGDYGCQRDRGHDGDHRDRNGRTWPPSDSRPRRVAALCKARPLSGDLSCVLPITHDGRHRNWQGIEWTPENTLSPRCAHKHPTFANAVCDGPLSHPGGVHGSTYHGITWEDASEPAPDAGMIEPSTTNPVDPDDEAMFGPYGNTWQTRARRLRAELDAAVRVPHLGCATTLELIGELQARAHVADTIGEKWPTYRTVDDQ